VGKIAKKTVLKEYVFLNSSLKIQCHVVKYTPRDCLFGDFAHWVDISLIYFLYYLFFIQKLY